MEITADPQMPTIPLPEVFRTAASWSYSNNAFVSPVLGVETTLTPEITDPNAPEIVLVSPPDRYQVFNTPGPVQYVFIPPPPPPTKDDPTGMKEMMSFLGFKKDLIDAAHGPLGGTSKDHSPAITGVTSEDRPVSDNYSNRKEQQSGPSEIQKS